MNNQASSSSDFKMSILTSLVNDCLRKNNGDDLYELQTSLAKLNSCLTDPDTCSLIINYPKKVHLGECLYLMLKYDWIRDPEVREMWAEFAFYCLTEDIKYNITSQEGNLASMLDMFLLLDAGGDSLHTLLHDILDFTEDPNYSFFFTPEDRKGGAKYLIREFLFYTATFLLPLDKKYSIISPGLKPAFRSALYDNDFSIDDLGDIWSKMIYVSHFIEKILKELDS